MVKRRGPGRGVGGGGEGELQTTDESSCCLDRPILGVGIK